MLNKLLKHEFRATGRVMLPALAALAVLSVLTDISFRTAGRIDNSFINSLLAAMFTAYIVCLMASSVMCFVLMILRFRRSLLGEEGYISMTLPVSVHGHIWCKLIVSLVWFALTALVCFAAIGATAMVMGEVSMNDVRFFLGALERPFRMFLDELKMTGGEFTGCVLMAVLTAAVVCVTMCLRFYAALTIGHAAADHKWLFSLGAYVGLTAAVRVLTLTFGFNIFDTVDMKTAVDTAHGAIRVMALSCGYLAAEGAAFYAITALTLKRSINVE